MGLTIGFVLDDGLDKPDGVQQYILTLGGWLNKQGHTVHYIVGETKRTDIPNLHSMSKNVQVNFNGNSMTIPLPASRGNMRKLLAKHRFDVLHVQAPYSPFMAQRLIKLAPKDTAVIATFHIAPHNKLVYWANYLLGFWLKATLRRLDTMVSVSVAAANFAKGTFRMQTSILPNVIDYPHFHGAKPFPQYDDTTPTILFLGRLVPRKGSMLLLDAVRRLRDREPELDYRVLVCGRGPLQSRLEAFIAEHRLEEIVHLTGFVSEEDKPRYYASADISVFPSSGGESFGIVLLEAMASGNAAVLAGDNPGYRSVMEVREELLFDPKNADDLAEKLAKYVRDAGIRRKAAEWGVKYARDFDVAAVGKQLEELYLSALHKRRQ